MKKNKKVLASLVMGVVLFSLASCSSANQSVDDTTNSGEKVTVNIYQFKVEINDQLKDAISTYMNLNPNVTINLETVGGGDDYGAGLKSKFSSDTTIFNIGGPQDVEDWLSKLEDLSDQPWVEHASEGILDGVTMDGVVYGMPIAIEGYGLVYNKAIFEACGIKGDEIDTFKELEETYEIIQAKIDSGELAEQFPLLEAVTEYPAKETWVSGLHSSNAFLNLEFSSVMDTYEAENVEFTYGDQFKKYIDLTTDYTPSSDNKSKLNAIDYATQVGGGLAIERVAIIQQGNWIYNEVANIDESVAENLGLLPIPIEGVVEDSIPIGVPNNWAINKEADEAAKEAAKDFLNWLYQSEEGKNIVVNEFLFIPPFTNYGDIEPQDSLGKAIKAYSDSGKTTSWVFGAYPTSWGQEVLGAKMQGYLDGTLTWEKFIEECKKAWTDAR